MGEKFMKISVIIPAHNEEKRIGTALQALQAQDYRDFEVIVVDNNSTDKTAEVARAFLETRGGALPQVTVLQESRKGTMWACEAGRLAADGEIIVRMDADCLPDSDWLSRGAAHFIDPDIVMASGPYDYHDAGHLFRHFSLTLQKVAYSTANSMLQIFGLGAISLGGNTFLRAGTLQQMGGFNTDLTFFGDDTDTAKRASKHGTVIFDRRLTIKTAAPTSQRFGGNKKVYKYWFHFFRVILSD